MKFNKEAKGDLHPFTPPKKKEAKGEKEKEMQAKKQTLEQKQMVTSGDSVSRI